MGQTSDVESRRLKDEKVNAKPRFQSVYYSLTTAANRESNLDLYPILIEHAVDFDRYSPLCDSVFMAAIHARISSFDSE